MYSTTLIAKLILSQCFSMHKYTQEAVKMIIWNWGHLEIETCLIVLSQRIC